MSKPIVFNWPAASTTSVSALQTLAGAGDLLINGSLSNLVPGSIINSPVAVFPNISRTVTLTSTNNLSGVNFNIAGYLNGNLVSQIIAGPNNSTVSTTQLFQSVTSITADAAAAAVSAGTGSTGVTNWYSYDYYIDNANVGIQVAVTTTINYSLQVTLDDVNTIANPVIFNPITAMTNATTKQLGNLIQPIRYSNIIINSSSGNGALTATYIQQGVRG
jgi:hypothetical protein